MLDLNRIDEIDPRRRVVGAGSSGMLRASFGGRTVFPNRLTLRDVTTKPEDQGSHGSCAVWSSTTVAEMILWKIFGRYVEFSDDEIYNIYLDMVAQRGGAYSTTALDRMDFRGDGAWDGIPVCIDTGEIVVKVSGCILGDSEVERSNLNAWYAIYHYNDPDVRRNHYPDSFSAACFMLHNYMYGSMWRQYAPDGTAYTDPLPPDDVRELTLRGWPFRVGIPGHAVSMYAYDPENIDLDSSWNSDQVCVLRFPYSQVSPYYGDCVDMCTGKTRSTFSGGIKSVMFYDRRLSASAGNVEVTCLASAGGNIIGVPYKDVFRQADSLQLSAVPDEGYCFGGWQDGSSENPRTFLASALAGGVSAAFSPGNASNPRTVTVRTDGDCAVTGVAEGQTVLEGSSITFQAVPADDYDFVSWSDGVSDNPRTCVVRDNIYVHPICRPNSCNISDATISISQNVLYYFYGEDVFSLIEVYYEYYGTPSIPYSVKYNGKTLLAESDFDVEYVSQEKYKNDGSLVLKFNGKRHYAGSVEKTFAVQRTMEIQIFVFINKRLAVDDPSEYVESSAFNFRSWYSGSVSDSTVLSQIFYGYMYKTQFSNIQPGDDVSFDFVLKSDQYQIEGLYVAQSTTCTVGECEKVSQDGSATVKINDITGEDDCAVYGFVNIVPGTSELTAEYEKLLSASQRSSYSDIGGISILSAACEAAHDSDIARLSAY